MLLAPDQKLGKLTKHQRLSLVCACAVLGSFEQSCRLPVQWTSKGKPPASYRRVLLPQSRFVSCIVSLVYTMENGSSAEMGLVGND
jgi:hypothetical protein